MAQLWNTVTTNINNLTQSDLQLYLNQFITHLATIDSNASTLFQHFATPFVADTYAMAIENHLAKLGAYLFADPLNSNENRIDTIGELGTRLNTVSDHDEGRLYLKLLASDAISTVESYFDNDFNSRVFSRFADYLDSSTGFDSTSTSVFGGITHFEGKNLIQEMMDADNNLSDMKIILEPYDSVTNHHLSGIYSKIVNNNITSVHDLFDTRIKLTPSSNSLSSSYKPNTKFLMTMDLASYWPIFSLQLINPIMTWAHLAKWLSIKLTVILLNTTSSDASELTPIPATSLMACSLMHL